MHKKLRVFQIAATVALGLSFLIPPSAVSASSFTVASSWTTAAGGQMLAGRSRHSTVAYNGYIYASGGLPVGAGSSVNTVEYASLNTSTGAVGTWQYTTSLPLAVYSHTMFAYGGYMYIAGGRVYPGSASADVYSAPINPATGAIGSWSFLNTMPATRYEHSATVYNGRVYIMGADSTAVWYATLAASGQIGAWSTATSLATNHGHESHAAVFNGYIYNVWNDIYTLSAETADFAPINPDGSLGTWASATGGAAFYSTMYAQGDALVLDGYLTSIGSAVGWRPFNADGTLGAPTGNGGPGNRSYVNYVAYGRYFYLTGGYAADPQNLVQYTQITSDADSCDTNSVAYCGAYSPAELLDKINFGDGMNTAANLQQIYYTELGYTSTTVSNMVNGTMYANGDIYVGATKVATNGRPSGREQQHLSDTHVGSLWRRADSNFRVGVSTIDVMVNMDGGSFQFAVMKPCGNPVVATPFSTTTPTPAANYHPLEPRSATLSKSRTVDPSVHFSWGTTNAAVNKAIRIQTCDSPTSSVACVKPTGSDMTSVTLTSTGGQLGGSGWSLAVVNDHEILLTNSTGISTTVGGNSQVDIASFVNPSFNGTFFFRVTTYSDVAGTANVAYGAIAVSTAQSLTETADVAEALTFRVANSVASDCLSQTDVSDPNDSASDLVILSPSTATVSSASIGTAQMCIVSNAGSGFIITYHDAASGGATKGFYDGSHEFPTANNFTNAPGTEQFGFNLRSNTAPTVGFDPDGAGLVADLTNSLYSTVNQFSYDDTGSNQTLATKSVPSAAARYTMSYVANISPITPAGTYKAHMIFVATGTF